jgi:hypothetical protein
MHMIENLRVLHHNCGEPMVQRYIPGLGYVRLCPKCHWFGVDALPRAKRSLIDHTSALEVEVERMEGELSRGETVDIRKLTFARVLFRFIGHPMAGAVRAFLDGLPRLTAAGLFEEGGGEIKKIPPGPRYVDDEPEPLVRGDPGAAKASADRMENQLLAVIELRMIAEGQKPPVPVIEERIAKGHCGGCDEVMPAQHPNGRRRRMDALFCDDCVKWMDTYAPPTRY